MSSFDPEQLIMVVDAYDVVLLPCRRSVVEAFRASGKRLLVSAEKNCWPVGSPCAVCGGHSSSGSADHEACASGFPNLNSGGYMGTAAAISDAFEWIARNGHRRSEMNDDQGALWQYYRAFPDRVGLDHRQSIWSVLLGSAISSFRVLPAAEPCGRIYSSYIDDEVCFLHANGNSKTQTLQPLLDEVNRVCGYASDPVRRISQYHGIQQSRVLW